ncbi:30S ribosomal protein S8 [Parvularcula flava]|uniref:Small ribosomal subunit protein uS8 n=1 Tax=Aquisalinus luteolus TaxID=1566827 RepID=A0A8J3A679_9PROT|nr:30S ribosomal protein S8 [Aquisalinus luteolus]NHK27337.1 30S ribosomal protein S8 [Aquisalinus luteolus]GGH95129.1 30S ribosomal protein S8 [Aquisalinus luteolus]
MAINDPVGDMLARIRNAQMRGHKVAMTPASKVRGWVLDVLEREGYIRGYTRVEEAGNKAHFEIELKYFDGEPVIQHIKRVSKPGRRVYSAVNDLAPVRNGLGISIVSTSKGIMSDAAAREANVGGEVLAQIY